MYIYPILLCIISLVAGWMKCHENGKVNIRGYVLILSMGILCYLNINQIETINKRKHFINTYLKNYSEKIDSVVKSCKNYGIAFINRESIDPFSKSQISKLECCNKFIATLDELGRINKEYSEVFYEFDDTLKLIQVMYINVDAIKLDADSHQKAIGGVNSFFQGLEVIRMSSINTVNLLLSKNN